MEPRELWDRNTVLAEAFCASDDRVRQAQSVLDEAQAERTRTLAAFAVTVGNDSSVADLMGLHEREVRVARRTVGKEEARTMAADLLTRPAGPERQAAGEEPPAAEATDARTVPPGPAAVPEVQLPHPRSEAVPPLSGLWEAAHPPGAGAVTQGHGTVGAAASEVQHPAAPVAGPELSDPVREAEGWSASMDSVLVWSWQSGVDLQFVAGELGLDLRALLVRVQTLAAEGRLSLHAPPPPSAEAAGRHRRRQGGSQVEEFPDGQQLADAVRSFVPSTACF